MRPPVLTLATLLIGFFLMQRPAGHPSGCAPGSTRLAVSGELVVMQGIGTVFGPLLVRALMDWQGARGLPVGLALLQGAIAAWGLLRVVARDDPETRERRAVHPLTAHPVRGELSGA